MKDEQLGQFKLGTNLLPDRILNDLVGVLRQKLHQAHPQLTFTFTGKVSDGRGCRATLYTKVDNLDEASRQELQQQLTRTIDQFRNPNNLINRANI